MIDGAQPPAGFTPVYTGAREEWLLRPVLEGLCKYESLIDGTLDIDDVARLNEALDVRAENQRRAEIAARSASKRTR